MSAKLVWTIILCGLIIRSEFPTANAANSCENQNPDINLNPILAQGGLDFSINLYKQVKDEKNVFISPFSVRVAMAMMVVGAEGPTLTQMNTVLGLEEFQNKDQINQAFQSLIGSFCPNNNYVLSIANRIYVQKDFSISNSFIENLQKYYMSSAENVVFADDGDATVKKINSWIEKQTNNIIKDMISPGTLTSETVLLLVNAIYFKGKWKTQFDPANTQPQDFTLDNGETIKVPTMYAYSDFKISHSEALKSGVLQMNYDGERLAMHIILPDKGTSFESVKQNLNPKNVNDYIDNSFIREVKVYLPKFKSSYKQSLNDFLKAMGITELFANSADLTEINSVGGVFVSDVIHQAYVEVDEEGTTAAAATAVGAVGLSMSSSAPVPPEFRVDRPCIYLIFDLKFKQILFMGSLDDPST